MWTSCFTFVNEGGQVFDGKIKICYQNLKPFCIVRHKTALLANSLVNIGDFCGADPCSLNGRTGNTSITGKKFKFTHKERPIKNKFWSDSWYGCFDAFSMGFVGLFSTANQSMIRSSVLQFSALIQFN